MNNFENLATIYDIIKEMPVKDIEAEAKAIAHQNQLTKPPGALGILEELAVFFGKLAEKNKAFVKFGTSNSFCRQSWYLLSRS